MNSFRISVFALAALGSVLYSHARTLDPQEALKVAIQRPVSAMLKAPANNFNHVYTLTDSALSIPTVYVYASRSGSGYLMASASDRTVALLGYSATGDFNASDINPELDYWLNYYSAQVAQVEANPDIIMTAARADESRVDIDPLISTNWNQTAPYNQDCPEVLGQRSVTGCVPTAFAQIMRYHQWPVSNGTGENSYTWKVVNQHGLIEEFTESMDFSTVKFDWSLMPDRLTSESTKEQIDEVAALMYACGVMSEARYTYFATAASENTALIGLLRHMDYDKSATVEHREYYSLDGWAELIYNELAEKRPVVFSGQTGPSAHDTGHTFICDGYQGSDGYFHFNWGWGGYSDAYFALTDLTPNEGGTGAGDYENGYNWKQTACVGIKPSNGNSDYALMLAQEDNLDVDENIYGREDWVELSGKFINISLVPVSFYFGLKLTNYDNPEAVTYIYNSAQPEPEELGANYFWQYAYVHANLFPIGKYYVSAVYKLSLDGEWHDFIYPYGLETKSIVVEANNEYVAFNGVTPPTIKPLKLINKDMSVAATQFPKSSEIVLTGIFWNQSSSSSIAGRCGLKFVDIDNRETVYYAPSTHTFKLKPTEYLSKWYGDARNVPAGKYIVTPVFQINGESEWLDFEYQDLIIHSLTCEVTEDVVKFYEIDGISDIIIDSVWTDTRYFDLMGHEVESPSAGIYIRVRGGKAEKVYFE